MIPQPNFFEGEQLNLFDMCFFAINTSIAVSQRINSDLYNPGVVNGLTCFSSSTETGTIAFTSGLAYDSFGSRISVPSLQDEITYNGGLLNNGSTYDIYLNYLKANDTTLGIDIFGASQFRHYIDGFNIQVVKVGSDSPPANGIELTEVHSTTNGSSLIFNNNVRPTFSAKFPTTNTSSNNPVGNLNLSGGLIVGGTTILNNSLYMASNPIILRSQDGTKLAELILDNTGYLDVVPINFSYS